MGKVLFYCVCFLAATTLLNAISVERCKELQKPLSQIIEQANKTHPESFHVPVDVKHNCIDSALTCFRTQVPKLQARADLLNKVKLTRLLNQKDCTPCHNYSIHKPSEFLEKMNAFLQKIIFNSGK